MTVFIHICLVTLQNSEVPADIKSLAVHTLYINPNLYIDNEILSLVPILFGANLFYFSVSPQRFRFYRGADKSLARRGRTQATVT